MVRMVVALTISSPRAKRVEERGLDRRTQLDLENSIWKGQRHPHPQGPIRDRASMSITLPVPAKIFTIFEGTSEIQRMIIGRAVTGLDVR